MNHKKLIQISQSFLFLPLITMSMPVGSTLNPDPNIVPTAQSVLSQKLNIGADALFSISNLETEQKAQELKEQELKAKADAIDAYFAEHDMPLEGTGMLMVLAADKNGIDDWTLLPAIAVRESTGGKEACKKVQHNFFGWNSCHTGFKSDEEAIETVAEHLGGNVDSTARHYSNKTTKQILQAYNPPSVVQKYAEQVMKIMDDINGHLGVTSSSNNNA